MAFTFNVAITEPEKLAGTYSLMNRLLLQGTKKYSNTELAKVLDENAIELYTDMKQDYLRVRFVCLNEDFELAIKILDDIINNTTFIKFDKENNTIIYDIGDNVHAVEITEEKVSIIDKPEKVFRSNFGDIEQVLPDLSTPATDVIPLMKKYIKESLHCNLKFNPFLIKIIIIYYV